MATEATPKGQLSAAEPLTLADAVQYATGSIVSRTLLKGDAGTLTLFAFDEGQALSEHTAPFDAVVQVLEGSARLTVGGKTIAARAGDLVLMPANVPHGVQAASRFKMLLTMFKTARKL
jgi:quercetin dioxygenase-like cupin family protein